MDGWIFLVAIIFHFYNIKLKLFYLIKNIGDILEEREDSSSFSISFMSKL